jgi:hypothetical protein
MVYFLQGLPRHAGLGIDAALYLEGGYDAINAATVSMSAAAVRTRKSKLLFIRTSCEQPLDGAGVCVGRRYPTAAPTGAARRLRHGDLTWRI